MTRSSAASGSESAAWAFAAHWAADWLRRATRLSPPPVRPMSIVVGDATARRARSRRAVPARARAVLRARRHRRAGLSARGVARDRRRGRRPPSQHGVVAGSHLDDDTVARWAYAIRLAAGAMPVAVYRRGDRIRVRTTGTRNLPAGPGAALRRIVELIEAERVGPAQVPRSSADAGRRASM